MSKILRLPIREASKAAAEYAVQRHGGEVVQTSLEGATCYAVKSQADRQSLAESAYWNLNFGEPAFDGNFSVDFFENEEGLFVIGVWKA